jgi:hypothetical protein
LNLPLGPLHPSYHKEIPLDSTISNLFNDLTFDQITSLAYLFNLEDDGGILSNSGVVKVQLDGSDWSKSISLRSVGVNQSVSVAHEDKGCLEVGLKIKSAPGKFAPYTKIVRLTPRFIVVNRINGILKVCQVGSFHSDLIETEVSPQHARPYHLSQLFGDRKVCLLLDGPWEKSISFSIDQIGVFTLDLKKRLDLASTSHVNTRGSAEYFLDLPSNRFIGLGFETDWGEENIVVKSIQSGSFAAKETDIRVGDVLIEVDGVSVSGDRFEGAMQMMKSKLLRSNCTLKLRTVEEKLRLMRDMAFQQIQRKESDRRRGPGLQPHPSSKLSLSSSLWSDSYEGKESVTVRVELRQAESSIVLLASEMDVDKMEEYRIENQTVSYKLYYRQRAVVGSYWKCLYPGQSCNYVWEDPFKPHRLFVHVGESILSPSDYRNTTKFDDNGEMGLKGKGDDSLGTYLSYLSGMKSESAVVINFDEIGFVEELPVQKPETKLQACIRSEGPTKVLVISPSQHKVDVIRELTYSTDFIFEQLSSLKEFADQIEAIKNALIERISGRVEDSNVPKAISIIYNEYLQGLQIAQRSLYSKYVSLPSCDVNSEYNPITRRDLVSHTSLIRLYDAGIEEHHHLMVEVLEGKEIAPLVVGKAEDIYCQIYIRNREKMNVVE